jgi:hypothetical protein
MNPLQPLQLLGPRNIMLYTEQISATADGNHTQSYPSLQVAFMNIPSSRSYGAKRAGRAPYGAGRPPPPLLLP